MRDNRLHEHRPWLILLRVDVQYANVAFKDRHDFTHEGWKHGPVHVFVLEGRLKLFFGSDHYFAALIRVSDLNGLASGPLADDDHLKGENKYDCQHTAQYEEARER